jgi:hypothetical protein
MGDEKIAMTLTPFGQGGLPGGRALKNQPVADFSEGDYIVFHVIPFLMPVD